MSTFIAREPLDLLAVVPWAIGFHPEESAVLLTFDADEAFHARIDLPVTKPQRRAATSMFGELVARRAATQVGLILYTADAPAARAFARTVVPALTAIGADVVDVLRVADGRFHVATDPDDPGTPYDLRDHPFTVRQVLSGRTVHESRDALAASLVGGDPDDIAAVTAAADRVADRLVEVGSASSRRSQQGPSLARMLDAELRRQGRWLQRRIRSALAEPEAITATDAGRILVLVALESVREVAWAEIDRPDAPAHVELWKALVRRAPRDLRAAPAALLAFSSWLNGEGALAWCALERCFEVDPENTLGLHVAVMLESATPPTVWAPIPKRALRLFAETEG